MKKTILFLCALLFFLSFSGTAYSEDFSREKYDKTLESYDLSSFEKQLDGDTQKMLEELGLLDFSYDSITKLSLNDIVKLIKSLLSKKRNCRLNRV